MKPGDVVFIKGEGIISKIIRWFDRGTFSHVAIFVSEDEIIEAEYSTKVRKVKFEYKDYEIIPMDLTAEEQATVRMLAGLFEGRKYDFIQVMLLWVKTVFGVALFKFNTPKKVICSELAAYFLVELGKADIETINHTPNELYEYLKGRRGI